MSDISPESQQISERDFQKAAQRVKFAADTGATELDFSDLGFLRKLPDLAPVAGTLLKFNLKGCSQLAGFEPLSRLTQLTWLNLFVCTGFRSLAPLAGLTQLTHLDIGKCVQLTSIEPLANLTNLTWLDMRWCAVDSFETLSKLPQLVWLNLGRCDLTTTAPLAGLTRLKHLNLYWCERLSDLDRLKSLTELEELVLNRCVALKSIEPLRHLDQLSKLYLAGCREIADISPLAPLHQLTLLYLGGLPFTDVEPLRGLTKLVDVDLSHCANLTSIEPLSNLTDLGRLYLHECKKLTSIQPLVSFSKLTYLDARSLHEVTDFEPLSALSQMRELRLSDNPHLKALPMLAGLTGIIRLELIWCRELDDIEALRHLVHIEELDMSACVRITRLEVLAGLSQIKHLNLYGIPGEIVDSASEIILALLPQLESFSLNHFRTVPPEIFSPKPEENTLPALNAWLRDGQLGLSSEQAVKILLLGNGGAGKSHIARRVAGESLDGIKSTHGVEVLQTELEVDRCGKVSVKLWDFGGQEIYHSTHALFAEKRAIYLIVWEPATDRYEEFEENGIPLRHYPLAYWADYVRSLQDVGSAVVIVQSKCDVSSSEAPIPLQNGLAHLKTGHCSALLGRMYEVDGLLRGSIQGVLERDRIQIPSNWTKVREELNILIEEDRAKTPDQRKHRTLSSQAFDEICQRHGCSNVAIVREYLSSTGVCFYRKGLFQNQVVLDQGWALEAIYTLFNRQSGSCREIQRLGGNFDEEVLRNTVWLDQQLSYEETKLLLTMMQSCFICFQDPNAGYYGLPTYFAPDLMPEMEAVKGKIEPFWPAGNEDASGFSLNFEFLHDGILRRLLCKIGAKAGKTAVYWRYGCAFYDSETKARALIQSEKPDKASGRGSISVQTLNDSEGVLLATLRKAIEDVRFGTAPTIEIIGNEVARDISLKGSADPTQRNAHADAGGWDEAIHPALPPEMKRAASAQIGILTALPKEYAAMKAALLDTEECYFQGQGAGRRYLLGRIEAKNGDHWVALALADPGNNIAAARATLMLEHFPALTGIIMVGIAGGVPSPTSVEHHVRLGDIVISDKKGVVQYDYVKHEDHVIEVRASQIPPSARLLEAVRLLQANELMGECPWEAFIEDILLKLKTPRPNASLDVLRDPETQVIVAHPPDAKRKANLPKIFTGSVGSANVLLKSGVRRDQLRDKFGVKAIEMEGSGVADATWNHEKGYLVVRGICDYCDTHKSDAWQEYGAAAAAGFTKALIASLPI